MSIDPVHTHRRYLVLPSSSSSNKNAPPPLAPSSSPGTPTPVSLSPLSLPSIYIPPFSSPPWLVGLELLPADTFVTPAPARDAKCARGRRQYITRKFASWRRARDYTELRRVLSDIVTRVITTQVNLSSSYKSIPDKLSHHRSSFHYIITSHPPAVHHTCF